MASTATVVDNLLVEMGKWDLGLEDLLMVVNFFSKVTVDDQGRFHFVSGNSRAGDYVATVCPDGRPAGAHRAAASPGSGHRVCPPSGAAELVSGRR